MSVVTQESTGTEVLSSRREMIEAMEGAHETAVEYWARYDTPAFFRKMGTHWSASEHVRHLTRAMTPLLPVLRVPRMALRLVFGAPTRASRTIGEIAALYTAALDAGGTAGRYTPSPEPAPGSQVRRDRIMDTHSETLRGLTQAMERWTEVQLDTFQLPHPLLGRLTIREMMLFTLLHNRHHVNVAERRRLQTALQYC